MANLIEIKFIKDLEDFNNKGELVLKHKRGDVCEASKENAEKFIKLGYAEYVNEEPEGISPKVALESVQRLLDLGKLKAAKEYIDKCDFKKVEDGKDANLIKEFWILSDLVGERILKEVPIKEPEILTAKEFKKLPESEQKRIIEYWEERAKSDGVDFEIVDGQIQLGKKEEEEEEIIYTEPGTFFTHHKKGINKGKIKAFVPKLLGDYIKEEIIFKTVEGNDKQIYYYSDGYYKENGISLIKTKATQYLGKLFKNYYINEIEAYIRNTTYIKIDTLNHDWINLQNGLLNPVSKEFKPHTPDVFCLHQLDLNYDAEATCDEFLKQLKIKCPKDEIFESTQQMFGYCFLKDQRFEKAFLLHGDPRTFKSTLLYLLTRLLGFKSVEAISLQELEQDKYLAAHLFGKLANICADLSPKELWNTGTFMKITGQDLLTAGKKFEQQLTFAPFSKLIFSCNVVPPTNNKNLAFYRRWLPLEYNVQTPKDEIDIDMREKLIQELPGILNWALKGLDELLEHNKFSYDPTDEQIKDFYEKYSDSIQSFIFNEISMEQDDVAEKKREVFQKYNEYCKKNKLTPENIWKFGKSFKMLTGSGEKRIGTIPAYSGVIFKDKLDKGGLDSYM